MPEWASFHPVITMFLFLKEPFGKKIIFFRKAGVVTLTLLFLADHHPICFNFFVLPQDKTIARLTGFIDVYF
jgi:hypothetical protein